MCGDWHSELPRSREMHAAQWVDLERQPWQVIGRQGERGRRLNDNNNK